MPLPSATSPRARLWIKICANTCVEDALLAASLGADALGFVFAASLRQVTPEQVAFISRQLPPGVERVGVFTSASPAEIARIVEQADLDTVQLHGGGANGDDLHALTAALRPGTSIIQTIHFEVGCEAQASADDAAPQIELLERPGISGDSRVLVDAKRGGASGGLGIPFNWNDAGPLFAHHPDTPGSVRLRMILAGGLKPDNVAEAIGILRPWGIDVASGVEREPGRKDPAKLADFIRNARS